MDDLTIICRCEDVTLSDIKKAIAVGLLRPADIRKFTRAGMGSCQGRTCQRLLMQTIRQAVKDTGIAEDSINVRTPIQPVSIDELANWE